MANRRRHPTRPSAPPQTAALVAKVTAAAVLATGVLACGGKQQPQPQRMGDPPQIEQAPPPPPQQEESPPPQIPDRDDDSEMVPKAPQQPHSKGSMHKRKRLHPPLRQLLRRTPARTAGAEPLVDPFDVVAVAPPPRAKR